MFIFLVAGILAASAPRVQIDRVQWLDLQADRVRVAVHLRMDTPAAIRNLRLERMTLGGMPIYAEPSSSLDTIPFTVYLRDLPALRQMVNSGTAAIRGTARFDVDVPLLARLILFTSTAPVAMPIREDVPMEIPGGALGRAAASAALAAAGLPATVHRQDAWERQLRREALPAVVAVESTCGTRAIAFPAGPNRLITAAEAVLPALFDPALLRAPCSIHGNPPIERMETEMESLFLSLGSGLPVRAHLAKRATSRNMAFLLHPGATAPISPSVDPAQQWERLAVVTLHPQKDLRFVAARRENGRIVFQDPVAADSVGSPVFSPAGWIGMVQDENSALPFSSAFLAQIR